MSEYDNPPDFKRRFLLRGSAVLLMIAAGGGFAPLAKARARLEVGQKAPPLVLHTLDGKDIATSDLLGQVVIITFWATWCEPCRDELPLLSDYAARHAQDLVILGFSLDDPDDMPLVQQVAGKLKFPVGLLGSAYAGDYGRIWRIPVSFVIDREGRLIDNGWEDTHPAWTRERLEQVIDPLLLRGS